VPESRLGAGQMEVRRLVLRAHHKNSGILPDFMQ